MEPMEIIRQRHSVRRYLDKPLAGDVRDRLEAYVDFCNKESGLHIQLLCNEPAGFGRTFSHCANYLVFAGRRVPGLEERCGYYGENDGKERKSKSFEEVTKVRGEIPDWFRAGVEAALLAPTAMNRQAFTLELQKDGAVRLRYSLGPFYQVDTGIVKLHFEIGAGKENFRWAE